MSSPMSDGAMNEPIEDFRPHKLRQTFASINIIDQDGDMEPLPKLLGMQM